MPSQENYFVVRTGLGVGTQALFADATTKRVAIGKTSADYTLDILGDAAVDTVLKVGDRLGVNVADPAFELDVDGKVYVTEGIGIDEDPGDNKFKVNVFAPESVVITGLGSVGIGSTVPEYNLDILQNARISGFTSMRTATVTGLATIGVAQIAFETVGISTVGFATVANEIVGVSTVEFANLLTADIGVGTVGVASLLILTFYCTWR